MKKILLTLFFALSISFNAFCVEWYCNSAGAGTHQGNNDANAFDLAEALAEINSSAIGWATGDRMNVKADAGHTTALFEVTVNGGDTNPNTLEGYTTSIGDGGRATITRSGGAGNLLDFNGQSEWFVKNFVLDGDSGGTVNLIGEINITLINVETKNAGTYGTQDCTNYNVYAHNNGSHGIHAGIQSYCLAVNNGSQGISSMRGNNNIGKGNTSYNLRILDNLSGFNLISDGGSESGFLLYRNSGVISSVAINAPVGKYGMATLGDKGFTVWNNDFFNNDSDMDANVDAEDIGSQTLDPQFNDTANLDYTRTGTNLNDLGYSTVGLSDNAVNYNIDIGIDQGTKATVAPTFAGIVDLVAVGGRLRATWSAGTGTITGYRVFIRNGSSTDLFTATYFMAEVDNGVTEYIFTTEADGATLLQSTSTYYVGVRADNDGTSDSNTVSLSASADGDGAVPLTINDRKLGVTGF